MSRCRSEATLSGRRLRVEAKEACKAKHVGPFGGRGFPRCAEWLSLGCDPDGRSTNGLAGFAGGEPFDVGKVGSEANAGGSVRHHPDELAAAEVGEPAAPAQTGRECGAEQGIEKVEVRGFRGDAVNGRCVETESSRSAADRWSGGVPGHVRSRIEDRMNIIIVGRPGSTPRTLKLGVEHTSTALVLAGVLGVAMMLGVGVAIGVAIGGPAMARAELAEARTQLAEQARQLDEARQRVQRDTDALALRLGQIQAEATRLNALGQRLARMGKLEDGEFDFAQPPAVGGPARPTLLGPPRAADVGGALDSLEAQLSRQGEQLRMLEVVLFDREVERTLMPAGIPVRVGYMSSGFGRRADPFTGRPEFHGGVDFAGPRGTEILAVAGGVVSFSGTKPGYGRLVEIDHGNGYMTRYAHNDRNKVDVGDPVRHGDVIATMGNSGRASGVHVHFEVWQNGRLVNPSEYLAAIR